MEPEGDVGESHRFLQHHSLAHGRFSRRAFEKQPAGGQVGEQVLHIDPSPFVGSEGEDDPFSSVIDGHSMTALPCTGAGYGQLGGCRDTVERFPPEPKCFYMIKVFDSSYLARRMWLAA